MAETFYIYEIPKVKVGCTTDMERRQKEQRDKGEMILLESYTDIKEANKRERELQIEKGYPIDDKTYTFVINKMQPLSKTPEALAKNHRPEVVKERNKAISLAKKGRYPSSLKKSNNSKKRPIRAYTIERYRQGSYGYVEKNKQYIGTFESITQASCKLNIPSQAISSVLNPSVVQVSTKGHTFEYAD